ncbi:hypothetical protein LCGC14_2689750, partial [marine sediment metagenome]
KGRASLLAVLIDAKAHYRIRGPAGWGLMQSGAEGVKKAREILRGKDLDLCYAIVGRLQVLSDKAVAVDLLKDALKHPNYRVRLYAVKLIEVTAGDQAQAILLDALAGKSVGIQFEAAKRLAPLRDPRHVKGLVAALMRRNSKAYTKGWLDIAVDLGPIACDALLAEMASTDRFRRHQAARALGVIGPDRAVDPLLKLLSDARLRPGDKERDRDAMARAMIRADVAIALGEIGSTKATGPLLALLNDPSMGVRRAVVTALGMLGDASATKSLVPMLSDGDRRVRTAASVALARLQWKPAESDKLTLLFAKRYWGEVAKSKDPRAEGLLLKLVTDPYRWPDSGAVTAFAKLAGGRAVEPLIKLLKRKSNRSRLAVIEALGNIGDKRAIPHLLAELKRTDVNNTMTMNGKTVTTAPSDTALMVLIRLTAQQPVDYNFSSLD